MRFIIEFQNGSMVFVFVDIKQISYVKVREVAVITIFSGIGIIWSEYYSISISFWLYIRAIGKWFGISY
jgi:hypothetical protein